MAVAPTLDAVIQKGIDSALADMHVAMPAVIETYDPVTQKASLQPLVQRTFEDGTVQRWPVVNNVPIQFPRGGGFAMTFPIKPGDKALLVFSDRSLDEWLSSGAEIEPKDPRKHDESDAFAIPGIHSFAPGDPVASALPNKVSFGAENGSIQFQFGQGNVAIGNKAVELLDVIIQALEQLAKATAGAPPGPFDPATIALLTSLAVSLRVIKGSID